MGILNKINLSNQITVESLKERKFLSIGWGRPDGYTKAGKAQWSKNHTCWEYYEEDKNHLYLGGIYYFPIGFDGYVVPLERANLKPSGHVYIATDDDSNWERIIPVNDVQDLDLAITVLKTRLKELCKI